MADNAKVARTQRLMLLGALSEEGDEEKAAYAAAREKLVPIINSLDDMGRFALTVIMLEHAERAES